MGKKKRSQPTIEELLGRPWCYYCERDFEDLKLLISHQKAKHFKCDRCGRRLNTAGGLSVHMNQVHKETLSHVENALPNRQGLDVEIFGVEGMPDDIKKQHEERIVQNFFDARKERFEATGNPPPGETPLPHKKIRVETVRDLKKRFADFRAKKAAAKAAGIPMPSLQALDTAQPQSGSPGNFNSPFNPPQSYGQPVPGFAPPPAAYNPYPTPSALPARPPSLSTAPTLPQRPGYPYPGQAPTGFPAGASKTGDDIDELIRMAEAGIKPSNTPTSAAPPAEAGEKKSKKEKGRMVYADTEFSPEERMAMLAQYQWSA